MPFKKITTARLISLLASHYPHPSFGLNFGSPWQLLVATILSAQCRDATINQLTPALFNAYPGPGELAAGDIGDIEKLVRQSGFFRVKARNLKNCAAMVMEKFDGTLPQTMEQLTTLPGVARKTANVVLSNAFGRVEGIVVDTHVARVCCRLGMAGSENAELIETRLMKLLPKTEWVNFPNRVKEHGQKVCRGKEPACGECFLQGMCPKKECGK